MDTSINVNYDAASELKESRETVQHVVSAISAALGVDVAIIDTNFELVATSKTFRETRGTDINEKFVRGVYRKGTLVMPNPGTSGTAFLSVSAMMQIFGEEKGWELLDGLNKSAGQYTKSGTAPAKLVANGEYAVGISWDHAIYSRVEKGFPIEGIIPSEGTAYDLDSVAILKGCKNLEAAKKLVDWIGTREAMELVGHSRSKVTRPGVTSQVQLTPKLIKYNAVWAGENKNRIMSTWKEKFQK